MSNPLETASLHERILNYTHEQKRLIIKTTLEAGKIILTGESDNNPRAFILSQKGIVYQDTHDYTKLYKKPLLWSDSIMTINNIVQNITSTQLKTIYMITNSYINKNPYIWRLRKYIEE